MEIKVFDCFSQHLAADALLGYQHGCPHFDQRLGVLRLVIIYGMGKRYQYGRLAARRDFRDGRGAGPADNQIRRSECTGHVHDKRQDVCINPV